MRRMTLDEVVGANVAALRRREAMGLGITTAGLAQVLGVGEAVVRDMERPRKDRARREFRWSDLVALCAAFNTTLFDLVLPPEGVEVSDLRQVVTEEGEPFTLLAPGQSRKDRVEHVDRKALSWHLFGLEIEDDDVENLAKKIAGNRMERMERARSVASQLIELLEDE